MGKETATARLDMSNNTKKDSERSDKPSLKVIRRLRNGGTMERGNYEEKMSIDRENRNRASEFERSIFNVQKHKWLCATAESLK
jgi:hypothetical protein